MSSRILGRGKFVRVLSVIPFAKKVQVNTFYPLKRRKILTLLQRIVKVFYLPSILKETHCIYDTK